MKLQRLYLAIITLILSSLSNAQGLAPQFLPTGSEITWEGNYEGVTEDDYGDEDSGRISVESRTIFNDGEGTYQYLKTGSNTATINFEIGDEEFQHGSLTINFTSTNGGTYTATGTYSVYGGEDGELIERTYKASGTFEFSFLMISSGNMPRLKVGTKYSQKLKATGGNPVYVWSITKGKLPIGLKLEKTGKISGIAKKVGSSTFTVKVTDRNRTTTTKELTLRSYKL